MFQCFVFYVSRFMLHDRGFILSRRKFRDSDLIITFFGLYSGKISFIAKGIRKKGAKLAAFTESIGELSIDFVEGKKFYVITGMSLLDSFNSILKDFQRITVYQEMVSLLDYLTIYNHVDTDLYNVYKKILAGLTSEVFSQSMILYWKLELLAASGYCPNFKACIVCKRSLNFHSNRMKFSFTDSGFLCENCQHQDAVSLAKPVLLLLQKLLFDDTKEKFSPVIDEKDFRFTNLFINKLLSWSTGKEMTKQFLAETYH